MGLSTLSSTNNATKGEAVKEAIGLLRELMTAVNNPSDAKKSLTALVALSDAEVAKAEEAKAFIADYDRKSSELKTRQQTVTASFAQLQRAAEDLKIRQEAHQARELDFNKRESVIALSEKKQKERDIEQSRITKSHDARQADLDARHTQLKEYAGSLDEKHKSITDHEEELRDRAKKLKAQAENF